MASILNHGIIQSVLGLSAITDSATQAHCCRALYYLSQVASARKPMVAHGVVSTIKALSRIIATKPRQDLAATLCHLSEENGLVELLLFEGIDRSLGRMFAAASPETKRICALTVFNISVDAVTIKHFMDSFSQLLVTLTRASSNAASGNLIKAVYNAALVPAFHSALLSENIPRFLAQQLPNVPPPIQILALRALVALCDSRSNRAQILSQTSCKLLETMLTSANEEIQETTLLIVLLLSIDEGSRIKLCNWIPAATIVQTASQHVENSSTVDNCSGNASRDRLVYLHSCVLRNLCDSVLTHHELVEEGAVRVLLEMGRMDDNDVKSNAMCALCCILASSTEESAAYVTEITHELIALTETNTPKNCMFAVGALYNIACSDESLPLLAQSHPLLDRVLQLAAGDTPSSCSKEDTQRVVELVAAILYRLAGADDTQQLMLQHGVFPVLIRVIHQSPAGRAYALNALFLLAQNGGEHFPHGGDEVSNLAIALSEQDRPNSLRAVAAASMVTKNQVTTADKNTTTTTLRSAVTLLAHLARHPKNQSALVRNGAVFRFLKQLKRLEDEETILINCAFVYSSLTTTHKGCDHLIKEYAIEDIIHLSRTNKLVASSNQVVKELCMLALCRLSSFMGLEVRLIEHGAIDAVLIMALVTTDSALIKSLCIKTLANCLVAKTCVRPLIEHGIIWALSSLCLVDSAETRDACAVSLCNLSAVTNMLSRFLDAGAPRALVHLLKQKSDPTYATVLTSIKAIANLVANEKICAAFLNEELERYLSVHFSDPHSSEELRQLAAMVLLRVTSANDAMISLERLKNGVFVWMEQIIVMKEADLVRNCMLTVHDLTCNSTIDVAELDIEHILRIVIQVFQRHQQNDEVVTLCLSIIYNLSCQLSVIPRLVIPEIMTFLRQQTPASESTAESLSALFRDTQSAQQLLQREPTSISAKSVDVKLCCLILHNMSCCNTSSKSTGELLAALVNYHAIAILHDIYVLRDDLKEICSIATCNIVVGKVNTSRVLEDYASAILLHFVFSSYFRANHYHLMSVCLRKLINAPGNQDMLLSSGIIKVIVFMLAVPEIGNEPSINLLAALALLSKCSHHVVRLLDDGVLPSVIRIADAKGAPPAAFSYCFEILSNLCTMNFEDHVKQYPEINVISTLTKLSEMHHHSSSGSNNHIIQQQLQHFHPAPASPASKSSFAGGSGSCYYDRGEGKPLQPAQLLTFMMKSPSTSSSLKKNLELHTTYTVPARKWVPDAHPVPKDPPPLVCNEITLTETSQSIPAEVKQRIRALTPLPKETLVRDESADERIEGGSVLATNGSARSVANVMSTSLSDHVASARGSPDALRALAASGKKLQRGLAGRNLSQSGPSSSSSQMIRSGILQ
uniref:Armadillo repeat-containing domain-containing protein n=1 Tax=Globisporangium ultimum (strain ATCC 200006 / CBS 805.95 / DAOM BR144) TaxID=431595 RepID=K3WLD5_GLOUD